MPVAGGDSVTLTVVLKDGSDRPVPGWNVRFVSSGTRNTVSPSAAGTTDAVGTYAVKFTTLTAEAKTLKLDVAAPAAADPAIGPLFTLDSSLAFADGAPSSATSKTDDWTR